MAIPITNIPILTGEVAERFISQCDYNARNLAGTCWSQKDEERFLAYEERQRQKRKERLSRTV